MKKLSLLFLFSLFFQFDISAALIINGTNNCIAGQEYNYSFPSTAGLMPDLIWSVSNGVIVSRSTNSVRIRWNNGPTYGSVILNGRYGNITDVGSLYVNITPVEPTITNMNISTSGVLKSYSNIQLTLNYNSDAAASGLPYTITWTINNAGSIKTVTGSPTSVVLNNPGSTTITAKLKFQGFNREYTTTKTINLADGSLETPNLTTISGTTRLGVSSEASYYALPTFNYPVTYEWDGIIPVRANHGSTASFVFNRAGSFTIGCKAKNSKTGLTGRRAIINVIVDTGYGVMSMPTTTYQVVNLNDALIVSENENESEYVQIRSGKQISYQINNALTGILADQGKVINGNSIDISRLPKGVYVVTLNNGTTKEAHKISVR